jgi:hypothetical protein
MAKSTRKVTSTRTQYNVSAQRRDGKTVAVIEVESTNVYEDGRGYAGESVASRQVLIVPLLSLGNLSQAIVDAFTYDMTAGPEERYDLTTDAQPRIGLYAPQADYTQGYNKPLATFYTTTEGRIALQHAPVGSVLAWVPEEGEDFRSVIERKES